MENDTEINEREKRRREIQERLKRYKEDEEKQKFLLWKDIDALQFPVDRWRVEGLIPKEGITILASISGEGKTWIALTLARDIALGTNFLGEDQFKVNQCKVLYLDAENSLSEIQRRCRQLSFTYTDQLLFMPVNQLNLNDEDSLFDLISLIEKENIKVVILDTFRAVSGGMREEKAEEVRAFFQRLKALKDEGIAFIMLDHYRKPANHEGKLPKKEFLFGSQDKTANVESLLMMKKEGDEISLYQRKNRIGKESDPFMMVMKDVIEESGSSKMLIEYAGKIDERESKKDTAREFIPNILADGSLTTPLILATLYKEAKVGTRNANEALRELVNEGVIGRRKNGRKNEYFLITSDDTSISNPDSDFDNF